MKKHILNWLYAAKQFIISCVLKTTQTIKYCINWIKKRPFVSCVLAFMVLLTTFSIILVVYNEKIEDNVLILQNNAVKTVALLDTNNKLQQDIHNMTEYAKDLEKEVLRLSQKANALEVEYVKYQENVESLTHYLNDGKGCLTRSGGTYYNPKTGLKETYYSERLLPGVGLKIPGRHTTEDGLVRDEDGYICCASSTLERYSLIETSLGMGKIYDCGCSIGVLDLYTNW